MNIASVSTYPLCHLVFKGIRPSLVKATSPWQLEKAAVDEGRCEYKRRVMRTSGDGRLGLYEGHYFSPSVIQVIL